MGLKKWMIVFFILIVISLFYVMELDDQIRLDQLQNNLERIRHFENIHPIKMVVIFFGIHVLMTSLSIPGSIVLTLLSGTIFGLMKGTIFVSLAGTLGASISFLTSRYLFQKAVMSKFQNQFNFLDTMMKKSGNSYLFTLRLLPASPFVLVNLLMGLTSIKIRSFVWITFVSMIPGNFIFVYAGKKFSQIDSFRGILTLPVILMLAALSSLPFLLRKTRSILRRFERSS